MKTKMPLRFLLTISCLLLAAIPLRADAPATFSVGEFNFTRPAKWEWVEVTSSMRKAQLKVTDADSKASAEVVFFQFGPGSGSTQANIDRWQRQFNPRDGDAKKEETTVGKTKITFVEVEGTYNSGMPGGPTTPMAGYALMGAIMESEDGSVFVKMTGPKAVVKSATADFKKMVESGPKKN